jgi:DNA-binding CsgD family transcriptional regulator
LLGHRAGIGSVLNNLGNVATLQGDLDAARSLLTDSLKASREVGDVRRQAFTLSAIAGVATLAGDYQLALRLDAIGVATIEGLGVRLGAAMRTIYDDLLSPARSALGEAGTLAARASSRTISLDEAVAEALAWMGGEDTQLAPEAQVSPAESAEVADDADDDWPSSPARETPATFAGLTRRERDVAILLARGQTTNREIAAALVITEGTAANYVQRVLNRLELRTRAQVAAWAAEHGLQDQRPGA